MAREVVPVIIAGERFTGYLQACELAAERKKQLDEAAKDMKRKDKLLARCQRLIHNEALNEEIRYELEGG